MKFNVLWEAKWNEIEAFAWISMVVGMVMFAGGLMWDKIAGVQVQHAKGLGVMQILWLAFWGLYTLYGFVIQDRWGE